ncbi:MAG: amidase [Candidatus Bathyarchaeota archaeon]|nr:MAG: amidase [Candidatus Bathyarchaeota archaeon]
MDELIYASATELARAIRAKEVSSKEVVDAYLQRIEDVNPKLNAVVQLTADVASAQAREADVALARGHVKGPLHGVPITIKDNIETADVICTGGTKGRASFVPTEDATVVARMRAAGAILLGKTNMPELGLACARAHRCTSGGSSLA